MLGWFQSLMPSQGRFFEQFEAHAATLVAGAAALQRLVGAEGGNVDAAIAEIVRIEHEADDITRDVLRDVRRVFVTPFDRSAIIGLIQVMDDAVDQMNATATAVDVYRYHEFEPEMREMAAAIAQAAALIARAVPLLRAIGKNGDQLTALTGELIEIESRADTLESQGLRSIYARFQNEPMRFVVGREIFQHMERIVDRFEDVANEIQGLVIDHA
jgi:uncharacterized protein